MLESGPSRAAVEVHILNINNNSVNSNKLLIQNYAKKHVLYGDHLGFPGNPMGWVTESSSIL